MKKILALLFVWIFSFFSIASAIVVEIPTSEWNEDIAVVWPTEITGDESSFFDTIQLTNKYLWFALWAVCMGVLVRWGIQLVTANGDGEKMKKTNKLLMWALVGILICILSYSVIRLVVNLFT
jgi:hypothetical protein